MTNDRRDVVRFEHVSKRFRRRDGRPFLLRQALRVLAGKAKRAEDLTVLDDVSFTLQSGESVALVGLNRAGKSTLLRLIAGTLFPSAGRVSVRGRVVALLSLGLGLHPDMTGREWLAVNAALLGLSRAEVAERVDAIVAFAELDTFLDMPMRHYSHGMQARLELAVAVHTSPNVLLIDEALGAGDHSFQAKCVRRLRELEEQGVSLVLVSHSPDIVRGLCTRAIWLRDGRIALDGPTGDVMNRYLADRDTMGA